ncbi:MAG: hypothetical protein ACD_83C00046G0004 [uncultured bacterium]|nr:MAG: hypothetical protein ACD_83C00046G0004 [uncultured bacterium]
MRRKISIKKISQLLDPVFNKYHVKLAYIFGSYARGNQIKESDIDIAILLDESKPESERFALRLKIAGDFSLLLKNNVDLIILNDTSSVTFKYSIIHEGKLLFQEESDKVKFEIGAMNNYFDLLPFFDLYNQNYVQANL